MVHLSTSESLLTNIEWILHLREKCCQSVRTLNQVVYRRSGCSLRFVNLFYPIINLYSFNPANAFAGNVLHLDVTQDRQESALVEARSLEASLRSEIKCQQTRIKALINEKHKLIDVMEENDRVHRETEQQLDRLNRKIVNGGIDNLLRNGRGLRSSNAEDRPEELASLVPKCLSGIFHCSLNLNYFYPPFRVLYNL